MLKAFFFVTISNVGRAESVSVTDVGFGYGLLIRLFSLVGSVFSFGYCEIIR